MGKIAWCTSHYTTDFAKEKARQLREIGYKVSFGSYVKEEGNSYCKIYLEKDFNYYILNIIKSIKTNVRHYGISIADAVLEKKEDIRELCMEYNENVRIESQLGEVFAVINDGEYELSTTLM